MKTRILSHTNIEVSAIGLGTMGMDHAMDHKKIAKK